MSELSSPQRARCQGRGSAEMRRWATYPPERCSLPLTSSMLSYLECLSQMRAFRRVYE